MTNLDGLDNARKILSKIYRQTLEHFFSYKHSKIHTNMHTQTKNTVRIHKVCVWVRKEEK